MARIQIRTILAGFGIICLIGYIGQYFYLRDHTPKSRRSRIQNAENQSDQSDASEVPPETTLPDLKCKTANPNLQAFYYPWWANPAVDGQWAHWNHQVLPHWDERENKKYLIGKIHQPPDDLGTNFYPLLGPYSSKNQSVIDQHMEWACEAGIGTFIVSYFANGRTDDNGIPFQKVVELLFQSGEKYGIKIGLHLEPYSGRTAKTVVEDIKTALKDFGHLETFARDPETSLPIFYIYDSYQIKPEDWYQEFSKIRDTEWDAYIVGLIVEVNHLTTVLKSGFNAAYSYFASMNFSYGCTPHNWEYIFKTLQKNKMDFLPSVGPGYEDTAVRPWNRVHKKERKNGEYYAEYFQKAISLRPKFISVTSFNEWHEGTQIEPAIPYTAKNRIQNPNRYLNYKDPFQYLDITKTYSKQFHPRPMNYKVDH